MRIDVSEGLGGVGAGAPPRPQRGPAGQVARAVLALAVGARLLRHSERAWASVTFSGTRHALTLEFTGDAVAAGEAFIAALGEHEFIIPRHLVADATVVGVVHEVVPYPRMVVEAELLLLEDA